MAYNKTVWVNGEEPAINAENLNKIEAALESHDTDISDLKSALTNKMTIAGAKQAMAVTPNIGYVQASTNGNISTGSNTVNCYLSIDVAPGEVYEFTGCTYSESSPLRKALIWGDVNNKWVSVEDGSFIRKKVVVPNGAVKMYVNGRINSIYLPAVYKISEDFETAVMTAVGNALGSYDYSDFDVSELQVYDGFLKYEAPNTETITEGTGYKHIIIPVTAGEHYKYFNNVKRDTVQYECVNNINCRCLRGTNLDLSNGGEIVIPDAGAYLIINYVLTDTWKIQKGTLTVATGDETINNITNTYGSSAVIKPATEQIVGTQKWNYLFADNFNRADNATSLGNPGNNDYDRSYTALVGTLGISNNMAYKVEGTTAIAYQDVGVSDCLIDFMVDVSSLPSSPWGAGIAFRIKDSSNYLICAVENGAVQCFKFETGQSRERVLHQTVTATTGIQKFTIRLDGSRISLYINGLLMRESICTFNLNETKHGIVIYGSSVVNGITRFAIRTEQSWENVADTFDNEIVPYYCSLENVGAEHSFKFVDSPVDDSLSSMELCVKKSDNYKRSEIAFPRVKQLGEQVISFDMMLGSDYAVQDPDDGIIWQFHDSPEDSGAIPENANIGPNLACRIRGGQYLIHSQYGSAKPATASNLTVDDSALSDDPLDDLGKWVHWEIHVKWGYESFFDPFVYIYKDGVLVYKRVGIPNTANATLGSYFKIGPYPVNYVLHPEQGTSVSRTMWLDNLIFTN